MNKKRILVMLMIILFSTVLIGASYAYLNKVVESKSNHINSAKFQIETRGIKDNGSFAFNNIAPGNAGEYIFEVDKKDTSVNVKYTFDIEPSGELFDMGVPIRFKVYHVLGAGSEQKEGNLLEVKENACFSYPLATSQVEKFKLVWEWQPSDNDNAFQGKAGSVTLTARTDQIREAAKANSISKEIIIDDYETVDIGALFDAELAPGETDFATVRLNNSLGKQINIEQFTANIRLFKDGQVLSLESAQASNFLESMFIKLEQGSLQERKEIYNASLKEFLLGAKGTISMEKEQPLNLFYTVSFDELAEKELANISSDIDFKILLTSPDGGGNKHRTSKTNTEKKCPFTDIKGHWAEQDILSLCKRGLLSSYTPPLLKPGEKVTRAEAAVLVAKALKITGNEEKFETDEEMPAAAEDYILVLMKKGIFRGYPSGEFLPNKLITRQEIACVVSRAVRQGHTTQLSDYITDKCKIGTWARNSVEKAITNYVARGYEDATLRPTNIATRAETMTMVNRMIIINDL